MGPGAFSHRNKHLRLLSERVREERTEEPDVPVVVIGDLNLTPWSPVFHDFRDDAQLISAPHGLTPTWYRYRLFPFGLVLDHIMMSKDLVSCAYHVSEDVGSDHRFVTAHFAYSVSR